MNDKSEHLEILDPIASIKKRQEMYFGSNGATTEAISSKIIHGALVLGAKRTLITEIGDWWYICSDIDWLFIPTKHQVDKEKIFTYPAAFPEAGLDWYRSEVMVNVFSEAAFTIAGGEVYEIKGKLPPHTDLLERVKSLGDWGRVIGFKFNSTV